MRRNQAPSQKGGQGLHSRIGVAYPQGFVPPIKQVLSSTSAENNVLNIRHMTTPTLQAPLVNNYLPTKASVSNSSTTNRLPIRSSWDNTRNTFGDQSQLENAENVAGTRYFNVVWCKQSTRKHKKWEGDALLLIRASARLAVLRDSDGDGKEIGRGSGLPLSTLTSIESGSILSFSGKDIEIGTNFEDEMSFNLFKLAAATIPKPIGPHPEITTTSLN